MKHLLAVISLFFTLSTAFAQGNSTGRGLPDFTELVEKQGATVVNISTTQVVRGNAVMPGFPFDEEDPMAELFRRFMPRQPGTAPREFENKSLGSGFIISADGYILTNAHVVNGADEVTVRLTDKREFKAKIVGADKRTDVALIKIEATGLPTVKLGEVSQLKVGEWVLAIGSPFGFDSSVTAGIVSAKGRALPQENFVPFIQTDVAINPGNSGGPLFNMRGEVVGINSQIYSRSGGYMGVSFAIPIDVAMEIQNQLRAHGRVSRGRIGVVIQEVSKDLADSLGLAKPGGAIVTAVEKGGPADKAGLEPGDVLLKFEGKTIVASADLPRMIGNTRPGTKATLQVWHKGALKDVSVVIAEVQEDKQATRAGKAKSGEQVTGRLGLVVSELSPEEKQKLKLANGLRVEEVRGTRSELRVGDILLSVISKGGATEIQGIEHLNKLLSQFDKGANVTLLVRRGELQTFVTIRGNGAAGANNGGN